jgi:hypothetical protein
MRWLRYEDTYSKTLFDFHRIDKKRTLLKELEVDRETISRQEDLSLYISKFYANLYTLEPHSLASAEAQRRCWESVLSQVIEDMNSKMTQKLSLEEVVEAITSLPKGKAHGHDGLLTEFFQNNVERGKDHPHAPPNILGNALSGANLSLYQQKHDHLNPEIR